MTDADALLDRLLTMIDRDVSRIETDAEKKQRILGMDEARTIAGYTRTVADVVKLRKPAGKAANAPDDLDALMDQVAQIPALRDLILRGQNSSEHSDDSEDQND